MDGAWIEALNRFQQVQTAMNTELINLYAEIASLTAAKCAGKGERACLVPQHCCSPDYCEMTIDYARERHGVNLDRTNHEKLPLMGETGCTAAPHLRPLCSVHVCSVNSFGICGSQQENLMYWKLRNQIEAIEMEEEQDV